MRCCFIAFLACLIGANAAAQCPIQPRQVSFDRVRSSIIIRYYNSTTRAIRDVQFSVTNEDVSQRTVLGEFRANNIVRPRQEQTVVFPNVSGTAFGGNIALEVVRVSFVDRSLWTPDHDKPCKIQSVQP